MKKKFDEELVSALLGSNVKKDGKKKEEEKKPAVPPSDPLRVGPPRHPGADPFYPGFPVPGVGHSDLDPLGGIGGIGGGGGGMLMDPRGGLRGGRGGGPGFDPVHPHFPDPMGGRGRGRGGRGFGDDFGPPGYDDMFG